QRHFRPLGPTCQPWGGDAVRRRRGDAVAASTVELADFILFHLDAALRIGAACPSRLRRACPLPSGDWPAIRTRTAVITEFPGADRGKLPGCFIAKRVSAEFTVCQTSSGDHGANLREKGNVLQWISIDCDEICPHSPGKAADVIACADCPGCRAGGRMNCCGVRRSELAEKTHICGEHSVHVVGPERDSSAAGESLRNKRGKAV